MYVPCVGVKARDCCVALSCTEPSVPVSARVWPGWLARVAANRGVICK